MGGGGVIAGPTGCAGSSQGSDREGEEGGTGGQAAARCSSMPAVLQVRGYLGGCVFKGTLQVVRQVRASGRCFCCGLCTTHPASSLTHSLTHSLLPSLAHSLNHERTTSQHHSITASLTFHPLSLPLPPPATPRACPPFLLSPVPSSQSRSSPDACVGPAWEAAGGAPQHGQSAAAHGPCAWRSKHVLVIISVNFQSAGPSSFPCLLAGSQRDYVSVLTSGSGFIVHPLLDRGVFELSFP